MTTDTAVCACVDASSGGELTAPVRNYVGNLDRPVTPVTGSDAGGHSASLDTPLMSLSVVVKPAVLRDLQVA